IKKKIEAAAAVRRVRVNRVNPVGRQDAHHDVSAHDGREVVIDHAVVEQISQNGGYGADGQRSAPNFPPERRFKYSSSVRAGFRRSASRARGASLSGVTARTSTRPMVILIVGAAASVAGVGTAALPDNWLLLS